MNGKDVRGLESPMAPIGSPRPRDWRTGCKKQMGTRQHKEGQAKMLLWTEAQRLSGRVVTVRYMLSTCWALCEEQI